MKKKIFLGLLLAGLSFNPVNAGFFEDFREANKITPAQATRNKELQVIATVKPDLLNNANDAASPFTLSTVEASAKGARAGQLLNGQLRNFAMTGNDAPEPTLAVAAVAPGSDRDNVFSSTKESLGLAFDRFYFGLSIDAGGVDGDDLSTLVQLRRRLEVAMGLAVGTFQNALGADPEYEAARNRFSTDDLIRMSFLIRVKQ